MIGFDTVPGGGAVLHGSRASTQWASQGVLFRSVPIQSEGYDGTWTRSMPNAAVPTQHQDLDLIFVDPACMRTATTSRVSFWMGSLPDRGPGPLVAEVYDSSGGLIESRALAVPLGTQQEVVFDQPGIARLRVDFDCGGAWCRGPAIDDLSFDPVTPVADPPLVVWPISDGDETLADRAYGATTLPSTSLLYYTNQLGARVRLTREVSGEAPQSFDLRPEGLFHVGEALPLLLYMNVFRASATSRGGAETAEDGPRDVGRYSYWVGPIAQDQPRFSYHVTNDSTYNVL